MPNVKQTHTYVTLEISAVGYDEIAKKLRAADYGHCFNSVGEIDMSGIALVKEQPSGFRRLVESSGIDPDAPTPKRRNTYTLT